MSPSPWFPSGPPEADGGIPQIPIIPPSPAGEGDQGDEVSNIFILQGAGDKPSWRIAVVKTLEAVQLRGWFMI